MTDLISRKALYDKAVTLETEAMEAVETLKKSDERTDNGINVNWAIWQAILTERTAFKFDIFDAPSFGKVGHWIDLWEGCGILKCSECGEVDSRMYLGDKYCPNCGARMGDENNV